MQTAIHEMGTQLAVSNERQESMNKILENVVVRHDHRINELEKDKVKKDSYWKIAIFIATLALTGVSGIVANEITSAYHSHQ